MSRAEWKLSGVPVSFGRRRFVIGLGAGAAGLAAAKLIPATAEAVAPGITASGGRLSDWSIDDVWGLYPRYSAPIGFGRPREREPALAEAADAQLAG